MGGASLLEGVARTPVLAIDSSHPVFLGHTLGRLSIGSVARCGTVVPRDFIIDEPRPTPSFPLPADRWGYPATRRSSL
jgi:hypothetical protein